MAPKRKPKSNSAYFEPGSAVEVSIDEDGFRGSWFSATIIRCVASAGRFLVEYHNLIADEQSRMPLREVLSLGQLRPLPPLESHPEFKSGEKVDAFHNDGWWEGHVTEDVGNGRFGVYFKVSGENMVFPKDQLRTHRQWINHNWVSPITNHKVAAKGRETEGELVVKTKRQTQRQSGRNRTNKRDMISELPDNVLLHIMSFMSTEAAVRTSVLSKRWKDLPKCLTGFRFFVQFRGEIDTRKFVSWLVSARDHSCSLLKLDIKSRIEGEVLDMVFKYAASHGVQQLTMDIVLTSISTFDSLPVIFCCKTLTSLTLKDHPKDSYSSVMVLPKSLHLPALKSLHLECFNFTATDDDCAEPFSNCHMLNTLYLRGCSLQNGREQVLHISNSTLSSLKIHNYSIFIMNQPYKIALSTPNLRTFSIKSFANNQLSSACNLSLLGPASICMFSMRRSTVIRWLQGLANVKMLTLATITIEVILDEFLDPSSEGLQPPCFVNLESLKIKRRIYNLSDGLINTGVEWLLQNTPRARVDIIIE